jgi:hypothetical protein
MRPLQIHVPDAANSGFDILAKCHKQSIVDGSSNGKHYLVFANRRVLSREGCAYSLQLLLLLPQTARLGRSFLSRGHIGRNQQCSRQEDGNAAGHESVDMGEVAVNGRLRLRVG